MTNDPSLTLCYLVMAYFSHAMHTDHNSILAHIGEQGLNLFKSDKKTSISLTTRLNFSQDSDFKELHLKMKVTQKLMDTKQIS